MAQLLKNILPLSTNIYHSGTLCLANDEMGSDKTSKSTDKAVSKYNEKKSIKTQMSVRN